MGCLVEGKPRTGTSIKFKHASRRRQSQQFFLGLSAFVRCRPYNQAHIQSTINMTEHLQHNQNIYIRSPTIRSSRLSLYHTKTTIRDERTQTKPKLAPQIQLKVQLPRQLRISLLLFPPPLQLPLILRTRAVRAHARMRGGHRWNREWRTTP